MATFAKKEKGHTWFDIGLTSIAISCCRTIFITSGCFGRAYPCPILEVFNNTASIRLSSTFVPCQSVYLKWISLNHKKMSDESQIDVHESMNMTYYEYIHECMNVFICAR
jgi:hypothetical protein